MVSEKPIEEVIHGKALERIATLFGRSVTNVRMEDEFGKDLKPSFVSDWSDNEFDEIAFDIQFVANNKILKQLENEGREITTVADYCEHMVRCHRNKPKAVEVTLGLWQQPSLLERIKRLFVRS